MAAQSHSASTRANAHTNAPTSAPTSAHTDIRDALCALCAEFPDACHRDVDSRRAYPEAFVDALTKAGWTGCGGAAQAGAV